MTVHDQRIGQDAFGEPVRLHFPFVQNNNAIAKIDGEVQIVRGNNQRAGKITQNTEQLATCSRVKIACWFIQNKDGWLARQDASQTDAFPFAGTQFGRIPRGAVCQTNGTQTALHSCQNFGVVKTEIERPKRDVVADGRTEQLVVRILKEEPHLLPDLAQPRFCDSLSIEEDMSLFISNCRRRWEQPIAVHQ